MPDVHPLIILANQLRRDEGEGSYRYLSTLLQIKAKPRIWQKEYSTFREFLDSTGHGPYDRFARFERTDSIFSAYDYARLKKGHRVAKPTIQVVGFEAASQVLAADSHQSQTILIDTLRVDAEGQGHPLTYQAAVTIVYRVLKLGKTPTKSARGGVLRAIRAEDEKLRREKAKLLQIIALLRRRLRDNGISDALPKPNDLHAPTTPSPRA